MVDATGSDENISVTAEGDRLVISIAGEIDWSNVDAVRHAFNAATAGRAAVPVVFDIAKVEFLDSSFLQAILLCRSRLAEHGLSVSLRNPTGQARKVFEITGLDALLE